MKRYVLLSILFSIFLSGCASAPKVDKAPDSQAKAPPLQATQPAPEQQEQQAWDAARQESSEASYNRYLKSYPSGRYLAEASAKLKLINEEKSKGAVTQPAAVSTPVEAKPKGTMMPPAVVVNPSEEKAKGPVAAPVMVSIPGKNYEMGKYEVTQAEWKAVMGNNPSKFGSCGDTCPVDKVSWDDAQIYIQKLNARNGKQYRLPTEAEWEYACYGGSKSEYCGSNDVNEVAWTEGKDNMQTHPVGQKKANGYGLFDMSGNVMEWMDDCWEGNCAQRVFRGGSWMNGAQESRAAYRIRFGTMIRNSSGGFRLARTLP